MENLDDSLTQSLMINGVLTAMPQLIQLYPQLIGLVDMIEKGIDDYMESGKMVVLTKKNGVTLLITLDTSKPFTLNNEIMLEGNENPVLTKFEKTELKNKLLSSVIMQTLKDKYEKSDKQSIDESSITNLFK